jgi:GTPase SAR1 family protein
VVLGEVNVGKSNIVRRLLGQEYEELEATIGVEFGYIEAKEIDKEDPSITLNVQVWDTCKLTIFNNK